MTRLVTNYPARSSGYTFTAMRSTTGVMHLVWSDEFTERFPLPERHTLCGRPSTDQWSEVGAKAWYTGPNKCLFCGERVGPYATVKLWT